MLAADAQNPALYSALLASIHLMLFAMIVRLFSARTTRDYLFLALLAFSAMLASAILTVDTAFLVFFLVFLALCVSTFMGLEMRRSAEASSAPPADHPNRTAARRMHTALGIASGAIAVSALLIGTGIFFLLPRFSAGYLSGFNLQPSLISGFTDDVELGEIGEIKQSSALVMRIKVDEGAVMARDVRWRGIALTTFDGRRWFSEAHEPAAVSQGPDGWIALAGKVADESAPPVPRFSIPMHYTVFLEPMASDAIFVAAAPVRIRGQFMGESLPGGRAARNTYLVLDKTGSLANPFHNFANVRYDAVSALPRVPADLLRNDSTIYSQAVRDLYLQLPRLDPRIPALATQAAGRARNPYDQARAVEHFLRSHYAYTLDLSGPPQSDPLAHFLFERRAGHCEYFAAAMTVMMRSLGVPARYINGFLPGEYNDLGGDFIVRARDAHSWVEVFFPGYGWMTFDPTPPSEEHITGVMSQLGLYWDWFQLQWGEWVINYDFFHQLTLAQNLQRNSRNWTQQLRGKFDSARNAGAERVRRWQARLDGHSTLAAGAARIVFRRGLRAEQPGAARAAVPRPSGRVARAAWSSAGGCARNAERCLRKRPRFSIAACCGCSSSAAGARKLGRLRSNLPRPCPRARWPRRFRASPIFTWWRASAITMPAPALAEQEMRSGLQPCSLACRWRCASAAKFKRAYPGKFSIRACRASSR